MREFNAGLPTPSPDSLSPVSLSSRDKLLEIQGACSSSMEGFKNAEVVGTQKILTRERDSTQKMKVPRI